MVIEAHDAVVAGRAVGCSWGAVNGTGVAKFQFKLVCPNLECLRVDDHFRVMLDVSLGNNYEFFIELVVWVLVCKWEVYYFGDNARVHENCYSDQRVDCDIEKHEDDDRSRFGEVLDRGSLTGTMNM